MINSLNIDIATKMLIPTDGLIASYTLSADSDDATGDYNLTNTDVTFSNGAVFNSSSDKLENTSFSNDVYALSFWMTPDLPITAATSPQVVMDFSGTTDAPTLALGSYTSYAVDETFTVAFYDYSASSNKYKRTYIRDNISTTRHNIIINWDSSLSRYRIYLDGTEPTTYAGSSGNSLLFSASSVGRILLGVDKLGEDTYPGKLDNVNIYNRSLSADEITLLYSLGV